METKIELLDYRLNPMGKDYQCVRDESFEGVRSEYLDCNMIIDRYNLILVQLSDCYLKITRGK